MAGTGSPEQQTELQYWFIENYNCVENRLLEKQSRCASFPLLFGTWKRSKCQRKEKLKGSLAYFKSEFNPTQTSDIITYDFRMSFNQQQPQAFR